MQLQIQPIMIETRLWSYEYKTASQMDISDVIQHRGLQQHSSYDIKIANLCRVLTYH
jgi:hypothetical protein